MTPEAYGAAFEAGFRSTVRFLQSRGATLDRAEEAAQAAWSRGWQYRHQLKDEGAILNWVKTIALNLHRRAVEYEYRYVFLLENVYPDESIPFKAIEASQVLARCKPGYRMLLERQMQGYTAEEIGRQTGLTNTAVRVQLTRARYDARVACGG